MSSTEWTVRYPMERGAHKRLTAVRDAKQAATGRFPRVTLNAALVDVLDWWEATADMRALGIDGAALLALMAQTGDTE